MEHTFGDRRRDRRPPAAPLLVHVSGLPGAGRRTLAAALTDRLDVIASGEVDGPADLVVRVVGAQVRSRDRAAIAATSGPLVVVAGKADTRPNCAALAAAAAAELGRPVHPVSGLLAGVRLTPADAGLLASWQQTGVTVPTVAAAFAGAANQHRDRAAMMTRLGRDGLAHALRLLAEQPGATAAELTAALQARSGIGALIAPIAAAGPQIVAARRVRDLSALRLSSARGHDRAAAERRLMVESTP